MSDTKLRPEDLTSEERALLDKWQFHPLFIALYANEMNDNGGTVASAAKELGIDPALYVGRKHWPILALKRTLEAMRALFAPEKAAKVSAFPVGNCVVCGELVAPYNKHAKYEGGYTCQRPQPAPTEPATTEMPEAVRDAVEALRDAAAGEYGYRGSAIDKKADALEREWRNLSQPVAVRMTPELEFILDECTALSVDKQRFLSGLAARRLAECVAAVRAQAAQGRRMEKARKMLEYMRRCAWHENTYQQIEEALAELDAAEGKGERRG